MTNPPTRTLQITQALSSAKLSGLHIQDGVAIWGDPDDNTIQQIKTCAEFPSTEEVAAIALMADAHFGYSMPIGGVIAYRDYISPSGVGYDIGCGVKAIKTDLVVSDIDTMVPELCDEVSQRIAFGIGRKNDRPVDHDLFEDGFWPVLENHNKRMKLTAAAQLGTVGSGNHYVDILTEELGEPGQNPIWVACHFGSRGFGHQVASGYLNLAKGEEWDKRHQGEDMHAVPTLIPVKSELGAEYIEGMRLAGRYAYAGRDYVLAEVLDILHAREVAMVHSHHNFAWEEEHGGEKVWVVRKGATPSAPGQVGFVGGSMGDYAAIVEGLDGFEAQAGLYSTVHGAGRIMSRGMAKGNRKGTRKGVITRQMMSETTKAFGVTVRGGEVDESPHCYRSLKSVLDAHQNTIKINHRLRPIGVIMAGATVYDPYKNG